MIKNNKDDKTHQGLIVFAVFNLKSLYFLTNSPKPLI